MQVTKHITEHRALATPVPVHDLIARRITQRDSLRLPYFTSLEANDGAVFIALLEAFRNTGGLARAEDVASLLRFEAGHDVRVLTRWIATRWVLSFQRNDEHWLPLFQFFRPVMTVRPTMHPVMAELNAVMDPLGMTQWFASPNPWLDDALPADLMSTRAYDVLQAARADRFALNG